MNDLSSIIFLIADTFTDSLARLTGDEQKAAKTTAFDLQLNPVNPGHSFHKLDRAKDKHFWSVRVSADIRIIVHKTTSSLLLCYVDHHDKAYKWAERRKLEVHPKTGAMQLVELRERIQEVEISHFARFEVPGLSASRSASTPPSLFSNLSDSDLLDYGVPDEWLSVVKSVTEDGLLELAAHLPAEAAEALLELATGGKPQLMPAIPAGPAADPFAHPDAQRRFRVLHNMEELEQALAYPWAKWAIFLHPAQRQWVERNYNGPARISGSAGTGKTIVALHRAGLLAKQYPEARVLLTTFSDTLARLLQARLRQLISSQPRLGERIDVMALDAVARRLYALHFGNHQEASPELFGNLLSESAALEPNHGFSQRFLESEWSEVVDAWQLDTWESYRDVKRLGRKTRLPEARRALLWRIFSRVRDQLAERQLLTLATLFTRLAGKVQTLSRPPYEFIVVDEAQDISVPQLRFLAALGASRENALFFAGDLGQRIFQPPFSWKSLGVDIRGRSRTLHINYRTSHQIRSQADRLLGPTVSDLDGNVEQRKGTVSVFNGAPPRIMGFPDIESECKGVSAWLQEQIAAGIPAQELALIVRSQAELPRALEAAGQAGLEAQLLDDRMESAPDKVSICTMHLAKGLEFRAVAVLACDDEIIPLQQRLAGIGDEADLEVVYETERHLLYVACTRARDTLLVTGVEPLSEFLADMSDVVQR